MESCPDCGTHLTGGWIQRTREVIELPVVPVQVTEHVFIARTCPACRPRRVPTAQLDGAALGRQRLGVNLISRIATLREEGRLPIRSIQWYLRHRPSAAPQRGGHRERHPSAPRNRPNQRWPRSWTASAPAQWSTPTKPAGVKMANNGYVWTFSTPTERYFLRTLLPAAGSGQGGGGRSAGRVILRSTGQRLLRRLPPLRWPQALRRPQAALLGPPVAGYPRPAWRSTPRTPRWPRWAAAVHQLYVAGQGLSPITQAWQRRRTAQLAWERQLLVICRPFLADPLGGLQGRLCRRIERHIKELFVFVAEPDVPAAAPARSRAPSAR